MMGPVTQITDKRRTVKGNVVIGPVPAWGTRVISGDLGYVLAAAMQSREPISHTSMVRKIPYMRDQVVAKAISRIASSEADILVSLAEAKKTAQMLRHPFLKSRDLLNKMVGARNRNLKLSMNWAQASVSAYLEFRFGFLPTILDIQNISRAYKVPKTDKPKRLVARASLDAFDIYQRTDTRLALLGADGADVTGIFARNHRVSAGVLYELRETLNEANLRAYGARLSDVPRTMYELIPFSFVLDRFVNVGDWLQAMIPQPGVRVMGSWVTTIDRSVNDFIVDDVYKTVSIPGYPVAHHHGPGGSYREEISSKVRQVDIELSILPPVNTGDLSIVQMIDHFALMAQVLKTFDVRQLRKWETYAPKKRRISLYRRHPTL